MSGIVYQVERSHQSERQPQSRVSPGTWGLTRRSAHSDNVDRQETTHTSQNTDLDSTFELAHGEFQTGNEKTRHKSFHTRNIYSNWESTESSLPDRREPFSSSRCHRRRMTLFLDPSHWSKRHLRVPPHRCCRSCSQRHRSCCPHHEMVSLHLMIAS